MRDDPILQISCGDEHTGVVTGRKKFYLKRTQKLNLNSDEIISKIKK